MNILLGIGILVMVAGFTLFILGVTRNWADSTVNIGMALMLGPIALGVVGVAVYLILGGSLVNPIVEGACYRAVRHDTTTFIPVGKVLIPSHTSGIDLLEIRCP